MNRPRQILEFLVILQEDRSGVYPGEDTDLTKDLVNGGSKDCFDV